MAIFSNQATLSYNGTTTNSNIAFGEILDVLAVTKTAITDIYSQGDVLTYVVTVRNSGATPISGITVTDNLGETAFGATSIYPLTPILTTANLFINGVLQATPAVTAGPPFVISGISIPAGGNAVIVYQARVNDFADPNAGAGITNTVSVTGAGVTEPVTDSETVTVDAVPRLTITKSMTPNQVVDNERVTYTFVIENFGNTAVTDAVLTDTFNPILTALAATLDGAAFTAYSYDESTGLFTTNAGAIAVPAATYEQNSVTGNYTVTPGSVVFTVTGTI